MTARLFGRARTPIAVVSFATLVSGCPPSPCAHGAPVPIPAADATAPTVTVDVVGRGGSLTRITAGTSAPYQIQMPPGGVTVTAVARDPEGVRKVVVVVQPRTCTTARATGETTCTTGQAQIFTNEDTGTAGATGCTERSLTTTTAVDRTLTSARDQVETGVNLLAFGQNFGGRNTSTGWKEVVPRP